MGKVMVGGVGFRVRDEGTGPPLLLIHGTGGHAGTWDPVVDELRGRFRVIAYDRRAYTETVAPPHPVRGYLSAHADDAAALLDALDVPSAAVCGWSWGGIVGLGLAFRHPGRISQLFVYEPPLHATRHMTLPFFLRLMKIIGNRLVRRRRAAAEAFFRVALAESDGRNAWDRLPQELRESGLANATTLFRELDAGTGEDLRREDVERIRCPITIAVGARTAPFLAAAAERLIAMRPDARVVRIPDRGHAMPLEQPARFAALVAAAFSASPSS
jgi:pimeloyl-ACP methyl ester carboxylesterase